MGRVAALRFLTHTHDFAAYMGWHESLAETLTVLAEVIDASRRRTAAGDEPPMKRPTLSNGLPGGRRGGPLKAGGERGRPLRRRLSAPKTGRAWPTCSST